MKLVRPNKKHEPLALAYRNAFKERQIRLHGGSRLDMIDSYDEWLIHIESQALQLGERAGIVPATTFFLMDDDETEIFGIVNIRHELTPQLIHVGGHIGYSIHPHYWKQGYGTLLLKLALLEAKKLGIKKVLVTCNYDNLGSAKVIENNGGILENEIEVAGERIKRYWIDLTTD